MKEEETENLSIEEILKENIDEYIIDEEKTRN